VAAAAVVDPVVVCRFDGRRLLLLLLLLLLSRSRGVFGVGAVVRRRLVRSACFSRLFLPLRTVIIEQLPK